jgi:diguanylate cyclase (GGDEF)-like protein
VPPSDAPPRDARDSPRAPKKPVIVVAEDERIQRELILAILRTNGYDAEAVADGQQAVERVSKGGVDAVLLDVLMPRMGGLEACRLIKTITGATFTPVLLVTVKADPASRVEGLRIGADDYICKPFEEAELLARVQGMLRIRRLYDEMHNARARLERVSVHDDLTGLYNYRFLNTRLNEEFKRAERNHEPLGCCMMDVDQLRLHNEAGGRPLGDSILKGVAETIRRTVREADIVVRYGGDEFLVMLPTTHFAGSVAMAERVWRQVLARSWGPASSDTKVTLSMGIALYPSRDVRAKEALLKAAEAALSRAKRDGMNRICVFQQEGFIYTPSSAAEGAPSGRESKP